MSGVYWAKLTEVALGVHAVVWCCFLFLTSSNFPPPPYPPFSGGRGEEGGGGEWAKYRNVYNFGVHRLNCFNLSLVAGIGLGVWGPPSWKCGIFMYVCYLFYMAEPLDQIRPNIQCVCVCVRDMLVFLIFFLWGGKRISGVPPYSHGANWGLPNQTSRSNCTNCSVIYHLIVNCQLLLYNKMKEPGIPLFTSN